MKFNTKLRRASRNTHIAILLVLTDPLLDKKMFLKGKSSFRSLVSFVEMIPQQRLPLDTAFPRNTEFSLDGKWVAQDQWMARAGALSQSWWQVSRTLLAPRNYASITTERVQNQFSKNYTTVHKILIEEAPEGYQKCWIALDPRTNKVRINFSASLATHSFPARLDYRNKSQEFKLVRD